MDAFVEITRPDGTSVRHRIEEDQVTIGRSPTAGIPLVNSPDLTDEHMMIAPRADGCWVAVAQGATPEATIAGRTLLAEVVPWGTEIAVGNTRIRVTDKMSATRKDGTGPVSPVGIMAIVAIPLVAWLVLSDASAGFPLATDAHPPELFPEAVECTERGSAAADRAKEAAGAAMAKSDRYVFDAQDGIQAVTLYAEAAECYKAAGQLPEATYLRRLGETLRQRINEDYRSRRLRLERALEHNLFREALPQTRALNALLSHRSDQDPYVLWMRNMERRLQLMQDQSLSGSPEE